MNVTLSLDDNLVETVRKIAVDRDTTLADLVRSYLETLAAESSVLHPKRQELETLERTFQQFSFKIGKKTWTRAELHERS